MVTAFGNLDGRMATADNHIVDKICKFRLLGSVLILTAGLTLLTGCSGVSSAGQSSGSPSQGGSSSGNPPPNNPTTTGSLAVSPSTLSFGNVAVGSNSSLTGTLTASNADVTISSASWNGAGYSVSGITFPVTVPAGKSANYTVTFTPPSAGASTGTITFLSDASDPSKEQSFSGDGTQQGQQPPQQHSVALSWNPSTSSVIGYNVYRSTQSTGPYSKLNSSLESGTAYTDSTVTSGTTYYYVATSVDANNVESTYSNQAVAQIPNP